MYDSTESSQERGEKPGRWLLLFHQIPPKPDYFRVKVRRRLQRMGAVALKNSVYVLPWSDEAMEDFQWLRRMIVSEGGEATICAATFIEGTTDAEVEAMFRAQSDVGEGETEGAVRVAAPRGATWVTRSGVFIDRIASAWLIRRFIDPAARFKFVPATGYVPQEGELRFDMYEGEYTHEGDRCTFEVLMELFVPGDAALRAIGEVVHDIDLKDDRFGRAETAGIAGVIRGVAEGHADDGSRLEAGTAVFDGLYAALRHRPA